MVFGSFHDPVTFYLAPSWFIQPILPHNEYYSLTVLLHVAVDSKLFTFLLFNRQMSSKVLTLTLVYMSVLVEIAL